MEVYKGYVLKRDPQYCYWQVSTEGPGSVPACLQGSWATKGLVIAKIDSYRAENPEPLKGEALAEARKVARAKLEAL